MRLPQGALELAPLAVKPDPQVRTRSRTGVFHIDMSVLGGGDGHVLILLGGFILFVLSN